MKSENEQNNLYFTSLQTPKTHSKCINEIHTKKIHETTLFTTTELKNNEIYQKEESY